MEPHANRQGFLASHAVDPTDFSRDARLYQHAVVVDGKRQCFDRLLSMVRYGTNAEFRRFDPHSMTGLAGAYFRSVLKEHGYDVVQVDATDRHDLEVLKEAYAPRFVLFSSSFTTSLASFQLATFHLRRAFPDAKLVVGGQMFLELRDSYSVEEFQRLLWVCRVDAAVASPQGEEPVLALLAADTERLADLKIPSTYLRGERGMRPPSTELEEAGWPMSRERIRWEELEGASLHPVVAFRTSRSCAYKCAFCTFWTNQGALDLKSMDHLRMELEALSTHAHVRTLVFTDDTLNIPIPRFKELCRLLAEFRFEWYSFFRVHVCDRETAELMKASGCRGVFLGLESLDDVVLKNMNKKSSYAAYCRGMDELTRVGISSHANFICGFPGDREENAQKSLDFVDRFGIDSFAVGPFYVSPSTPVYRDRAQYGLEGRFFDWKHDTMDAPTALRICEEMTQSPRPHAVAVSDVSNRFWNKIMLGGAGYTNDEVQVLLRGYRDLQGTDWTDAAFRASEPWARMRAVLDRIEMPPPVAHGASRSAQGPSKGVGAQAPLSG